VKEVQSEARPQPVDYSTLKTFPCLEPPGHRFHIQNTLKQRQLASTLNVSIDGMYDFRILLEAAKLDYIISEG
jgi:hypothetical protein